MRGTRSRPRPAARRGRRYPQGGGRRVEAGALADVAYGRFADWSDHHTAALVHARAARFRVSDSPDTARPLFEEALRLFAEGPPSAEHAETLRLYANMLRGEGHGEMAVADLKQALRIAEAAGAVDPLGRILANLAHTSFSRRAARGRLRSGVAAHSPTSSRTWIRRCGSILLTRLEATDQEPFCGELFVLGLRAAADLAERGRTRGDQSGADGSRASVGRLTAVLERMGGRPFIDHPWLVRIPADRAGWTAEVSRAAGDSDPSAWQIAAAEWEKRGRPHRTAYAWWRCAEAHLAHRGRTADVVRPLRSAAATAQGMAPMLTAIERLAQRARIRLDTPAGDIPPASVDLSPAPYGLTKRERQVLRLVAAGRTNTQLGADLYISPKTAGVHVTNILRKLGVANRTEAAGLAERAGLLDDPDGM